MKATLAYLARRFMKALAAAAGGGVASAVIAVQAGPGGNDLDTWGWIIAGAFVSGAFAAIAPANIAKKA